MVLAGLALTGITAAAWNVTAVADAFPDTGPKSAAVVGRAPADGADRQAVVARTAATRNRDRATPPASSPLHAINGPKSSAPPAQPPVPPPPPPPPPKPAPVAGLDQAQMDNAIAIVEAGKQMSLPRRAYVVAVATALQESNLHVLANPRVPGSTSHPNQGLGQDYDSVGLFQQRSSWGNVDQRMDPHESARRFYASLITVPGWSQLAVSSAAQAVQRSAYPGAYAKHQARAETIVAAIP